MRSLLSTAFAAALVMLLAACSASADDDPTSEHQTLTCTNASCTCEEYGFNGLLSEQACSHADEGLACATDRSGGFAEVCVCTHGAFACHMVTDQAPPRKS